MIAPPCQRRTHLHSIQTSSPFGGKRGSVDMWSYLSSIRDWAGHRIAYFVPPLYQATRPATMILVALMCNTVWTSRQAILQPRVQTPGTSALLPSSANMWQQACICRSSASASPHAATPGPRWHRRGRCEKCPRPSFHHRSRRSDRFPAGAGAKQPETRARLI